DEILSASDSEGKNGNGLDKFNNSQWETKAKQYDEITNDAFIKAYLSSKESGKTTGDFLSEIVKDNPAHLTDEQVWEQKIKKSGLTDEETEEERENFKEMKPMQKKSVIAKERSELEKEYQRNFEKYSTGNTQEKEKTIAIANQAIKETEDFLTKLQDKNVAGILYDSTQLQKLSEDARDLMENGLFKKDGTWDVPRVMRIGMMRNSQHMLQKAYEKGKTEAQEEFFNRYGRPSKNNGIAAIPEAKILNKEKAKIELENQQWRERNRI
ncbi:MAG: hypothetical protein AABY40_01665, partial [Nanoarchaeota archaeon]